MIMPIRLVILCTVWRIDAKICDQYIADVDRRGFCSGHGFCSPLGHIIHTYVVTCIVARQNPVHVSAFCYEMETKSIAKEKMCKTPEARKV